MPEDEKGSFVVVLKMSFKQKEFSGETTMNEQYKISVVVPVFNLEKYIERTLRNILQQTHHNMEIVVVDDGSTDKSLEIIKRVALEEKRIRVIHQDNKGVTSARLNGVREATGDFIGFVDGDDEIESDMYDFLLRNALDYKADISHCGYQMIFMDGRVHFFYNTGSILKQDNPTGLKDLLEGTLVEPGLCNKLFHKSLFHSLLHNEIMDNNIKNNEDLLMNYYLFRKSNFSIFMDKCKYHYIVRSDSASRGIMNWHRIYDPIKVRSIILKDSSGEIKRFARKAYLNACLNTYNSLLDNKNKDYQMDKKRVRTLLLKAERRAFILGLKRGAMIKVCVHAPDLYDAIYKLYDRYLKKDPYN